MVQCDEIGQYLEVIGNKCSQVLGILGYLKNIVLKCDYFFATFLKNGLLFIASSGHTLPKHFKNIVLKSNYCDYFLATYENLGYFLFHHMVTLSAKTGSTTKFEKSCRNLQRKVDPDGPLVVVLECVVGVPLHEGRLADARIAD